MKFTFEIIEEILLHIPIEKAIHVSYYSASMIYNPQVHTWKWAVSKNDIELVEFFIAMDYSQWEGSIELAAEHGMFELVKLLHDYEKSTFSTLTIDLAASNGHTHIVSYLLDKGYQGSHWAADSAAANGHLETLKYLIKRGILPTATAMNFACKFGHLGVIQYLKEREFLGSQQALHLASRSGHIGVVKYLVEQNLHQIDQISFELAAEGGHLEVFKYLYRNQDLHFAMGCATINGHLEIVQYISELNKIAEYGYFIELAAMEGRISIVQFLKNMALLDTCKKSL